MKHKCLYFSLLSVLVTFAAGCFSNKTTAPGPVPSGVFSGSFRKLHRNPNTNAIDSVKANITLSLQNSSYAVTGDTSTLHAGSHGGYAISAPQIYFSDQTLPTTANTNAVPTKVHLNGYYSYTFDGTQLVIGALSDTLSFTYRLQKVN